MASRTIYIYTVEIYRPSIFTLPLYSLCTKKQNKKHPNTFRILLNRFLNTQVCRNKKHILLFPFWNCSFTLSFTFSSKETHPWQLQTVKFFFFLFFSFSYQTVGIFKHLIIIFCCFFFHLWHTQIKIEISEYRIHSIYKVCTLIFTKDSHFVQTKKNVWTSLTTFPIPHSHFHSLGTVVKVLNHIIYISTIFI